MLCAWTITPCPPPVGDRACIGQRLISKCGRFVHTGLGKYKSGSRYCVADDNRWCRRICTIDRIGDSKSDSVCTGSRKGISCSHRTWNCNSVARMEKKYTVYKPIAIFDFNRLIRIAWRLGQTSNPGKRILIVKTIWCRWCYRGYICIRFEFVRINIHIICDWIFLPRGVLDSQCYRERMRRNKSTGYREIVLLWRGPQMISGSVTEIPGISNSRIVGVDRNIRISGKIDHVIITSPCRIELVIKISMQQRL